MQFLNPALLWALPLVAIPIIIHILNKARFKVVYWGPMEFLLRAERENRRKVRLEHLLLLLLRCLAVACLALLVSRPVMTDSGVAVIPGVQEPVERVILLDDSGSMGYRSGRSSSWQRARGHVEGLIEDVRSERPGDFVTVVRASRPEVPDLRMASPGSETDTYLDRLKGMEPSQRTFDVPTMLELALLQEADEGQPKTRVIYIVTDLRRRDWIGPRGTIPKKIASVLEQAVERQEEGETVQIVVVDVGAKGKANVGVTGIRSVEKLAMARMSFELEITVKNYGNEDVEEVPLALESQEGSVSLPAIKLIKAGEEKTVIHNYTFLEPGARWLGARLADGDNLPLDDQRHMALLVQDQLKVLLINGEESAGPLGGETDLLQLALAPPGEGSSGVQPTVALPQVLPDEDLGDYSLVVACNLDRWPRAQLADLKRFVRRGGGLAFFLGDRATAKVYHKQFYEDGEGLLPCKLGLRADAPNEDQRPRLTPPSGQHPLVKIFRGEKNPIVTYVRAKSFMTLPMDPEKDAASEAVLRLEDRTPFIVIKPYGRGSVVLFNTTADEAWSSWPKGLGALSYVTTMHQLVRLLAPSATAGRNTACGEPIQRPINPARFVSTANLEVPQAGGKPANREIHAEPLPALSSEEEDEGASMGFRFLETHRAGVYRLELETQEGESRVEFFAANLDPTEGDLTAVDDTKIITNPLPEEIEVDFTHPKDSDDSLLAVTEGTRTELWKWVLLALALALVLEQIIAWHAAHHRPHPKLEVSS